MEVHDFNFIQELFDEGLEQDEARREAWLKSRCKDRPDLVSKVIALWNHDDEEDRDFHQLHDLSMRLFMETREQVSRGEFIGPYKIHERLAHGSMGSVYKAAQLEPINRVVALKLLPEWFAQPPYRERFFLEQQSLAGLVHPHIATVYDSQIDARGRPFYTMEYLEGEPITDYCDHRTLSIQERLLIFEQVCDSVGYAHQKGIIHRDLKPSNILVIEREGKPVAKLIDFGIAKFVADHQWPSVRSTRAGTVLGTPAYMSPEQASGHKDRIADIRVDIYSLGALLYELLSGAPPLIQEITAAESLEDLYRTIREQDPAPPSRRLVDAGAPETARRRNTTPARLRSTIQGELDWITMTALAKNQEDRYPSCGRLLEDLQAFATGFPVRAAPPRATYQIRKWVLRHKQAVLVAGAFLLLLCSGLVTSSMAWLRADRARAEAQRAKRETERALQETAAAQMFSLDIFREVSPFQAGKDVKAVTLLEQAGATVGDSYRHQPHLEVTTRLVLGKSFEGLGLQEKARHHYLAAFQRARQKLGRNHGKTLKALYHLAFVEFSLGHYDRAETHFRDCLAQFSAENRQREPLALKAASGLAGVLGELSRFPEAKALFEQTLHFQIENGVCVSEINATRNNFAELLLKKGLLREAEALYSENLADYRARYHPNHPLVLDATYNWALTLAKLGHIDQAEELYRQVSLQRDKLLGHDHPESLSVKNSLAVLLGEGYGRPREAVLLLQSLMHMEGRRLSDTHPTMLLVAQNLGHFLNLTGDHDTAVTLLKQTLAHRRDILGENNRDTLRTWITLGEALRDGGQKKRAKQIFQEVVQRAENHLAPKDPATQLYRKLLEDLTHDGKVLTP